MKRKYMLYSFAAALILSGCSGYRLEGSAPKDIDSVTMGPVINKTKEPAIELQVTHAMREQIQFDGRMKYVNEPANADAVIEITLTDYRIKAVAFDKEYRTTPELYRITIKGTAELVSTKDGSVIATSKTFGETVIDYSFDLTTAKRDALPRAAEELTRFMLDDLIEAW